MQDGSFDITSVTFPDANKPYRSFTVQACVAGELDSNSFTVYIYKKDCTEAAYINYVQTAKIAMFPEVRTDPTT